MILILPACYGANKKQQSVAQCQLDANRPSALAFRKNLAGGSFDPGAKGWDYREFMLTCMESKGLLFKKVVDWQGKKNLACYSIDEDNKGISDPFIDDASCYE